MRPELLQSGVPEFTAGQKWTGVGVLVGMAVLLLFIWYRSRFAGLKPSNAEHKDTLWTQLYHRDPSTYRLPAGIDVARHRDAILETVTDRESIDRRAATVSGGLGEVRSTLSSTVGPVIDRLPRPARRSLGLAVLVAILGAPAVSTAALLEFLSSETDRPGGLEALSMIADATVTVGTLAVDVVSSFPYAGTLFAFALSAVLIVGEWLFTRWWLTVALLAGGATAIVVFDHYRTREAGSKDGLERRTLGVTAVKRVSIVWIAGVVPTVIGSGLENAVPGGPPVSQYGAVLGLVVAFAIGLYYLALTVAEAITGVLEAAREDVTIGDGRQLADHPALEGAGYDHHEAADGLLDRLEATGRNWRGSRVDWALAGSLAVRRVLIGTWMLAAPLPLGYFLSGVSSGAYVDVGRALVAADTGIQALVLACVLAPIAVVAYLGRDSMDTLGLGLREAWSRRRVRLAALRRGVPIMAVVVATAIAYSLRFPLPMAIGVGVAVGLGARLAYEALMSAKYRISMFEALEAVEKDVLLEAYVLEDAGGTTRYLAVLNSDVRVLADTPSNLVHAVCDVYDDVSRGEDVTTRPRWRAEYALRFGIVDAEEADAKITERIRKRCLGELRDEKQEWLSVLEDRVREYPSEEFESWVRWGRRHGVLSVREDSTGETVVFLERDPWRRS
ncbi:hypothetical protein [Natronosalvus rutilus]|uniref:Uncharacterized protein n=1 Tax=Natronosalvus rutilus TaxID=2953753 RepID=A0A9E7STQ0_9EURY|nr:hypothetical protein [Natronosalvus rutilus]UTF52765.1 hypothetical protein NGM29_13360 [Natronosalvus rutilus]